MTDISRDDPFAVPPHKRDLLIRFWYPAGHPQSCTPAEYTSPKVWSYLGSLTGSAIPLVQTNSCWKSPASLGEHPVILATPGYTALNTDYTFIFEELASRGYIVISIAHPYESSAVEFPDGQLVTSFFGSHLLPDSLRHDLSSLNLVRTVRLSDVKFILEELPKLNSSLRSPLHQRLDLARVGILGHSLGGEVALASLQKESALKTAILLDPVLSPTSAQGTAKPVLIVGEGRTKWGASECKLWNNLAGPRLALNFPDAGHDAPSDAVWLAPYFPSLDAGTGSLDREHAISSLRHYVVVFLDTYLNGRARSGVLNGVPSNSAGAIVTPSDKNLCAPQFASAGRQLSAVPPQTGVATHFQRVNPPPGDLLLISIMEEHKYVQPFHNSIGAGGFLRGRFGAGIGLSRMQ
jgi:pimeloyl-ACP methyl ester carboxylesterase